jgi:hypothetical protein
LKGASAILAGAILIPPEAKTSSVKNAVQVLARVDGGRYGTMKVARILANKSLSQRIRRRKL